MIEPHNYITDRSITLKMESILPFIHPDQVMYIVSRRLQIDWMMLALLNHIQLILGAGTASSTDS